MTKPKITKLLAVAVLAAASPALASPDKPASQQQQAKPIKPRALPSGRPACGNTMSKSYDARNCNEATAPAPAPTVAARPVKLAPAARRILAIFGITDTTRGTAAARPRELKNGRAANGNIPSRRAAPSEDYEAPTPRETPREPNAN